MDGRKVVVMDGGLAALVAAVRLARDGHDVTLSPKAAPPALEPFTCPLWIADVFAYAGRDVRSHVNLSRVDPLAGVRAADPEGFARLLRRASWEWDRFAGCDAWPEARLPRSVMTSVKSLVAPLVTTNHRSLKAVVEASLASDEHRDAIYRTLCPSGVDPANVAPEVLMWLHAGQVDGWWQTDPPAPLEQAIMELARTCGAHELDAPITDEQAWQRFNLLIETAPAPVPAPDSAATGSRRIRHPASLDATRWKIRVAPSESIGGVPMAIVAGRAGARIAGDALKRTRSQ
jgi:hypothetical protein